MLYGALSEIHDSTGERFIVIIDEWDAIFRDHHNDRELENEYVNFLRAMFKGGSSDSIFELVYLTGILPIKDRKSVV